MILALQNAIYDLYAVFKQAHISEASIKSELLDFLSYLSASDGVITTQEAEFISTYLNIPMSPEELLSHIEKNNTYSRQFESTPPTSLIQAVSIDINNAPSTKSLSKAYYTVFEYAAKKFLECDGEITDTEAEDFTTYTTMLKQHSTLAYPNISNTESAVIIAENNCTVQSDTLSTLLQELNELIGLDEVKKDVNSLIHLQEINRLRKSRGMKEIPISNHLVFYGNPGTGKTTVARLVAKIYHAMGILSMGQLIEVDRSGLVAGYVGQTALKVQEVVKSALGGVLFIDEAYTLANSESENDYGQEAIDTLLKSMEDNRDDFVVIVAGYPDPMAEFIDSNPGLRSRFNKYIRFEDYDAGELVEIFKSICKKSGYASTDDVLDYVVKYFDEKYKNRGENFANAREVRNFFEAAVVRQADRLFYIDNPSNTELSLLILDDLMDT